MQERAEALARAPVFARLDHSSLERLAGVANELDAPAGQMLVEPGAKGSGMFVLLEGAATVDRRDKDALELGPGQCFGELALLTPAASRTARVRAKTAVRCLAIARDDFQRLLAEEPQLSLALLESVAAQLAARD